MSNMNIRVPSAKWSNFTRRLEALLESIGHSYGTCQSNHLAAQFGLSSHPGSDLWKGLAEVDRTRSAAGKPLLSVVVHPKASKYPSNGLFRLAAELGLFPVGMARKAFVDEERRLLYLDGQRRPRPVPVPLTPKVPPLTPGHVESVPHRVAA